MTTTIDPAGAAGPQPDQPPTVHLTKTTAEPAPGNSDQADAEERRGLGSRLKAGVDRAADADGPLAAHLRRAGRTTDAWLRTNDLTDQAVAAAVLADRQTQHRARETQLRQKLARISSQIVTAKRTETGRDDNDALRDGPEVVALKGRRELVQTQLAEHQETAVALAVPPTDGELSRARWSKRAGRAAALLGGVIGGGVVLPLQDPRLLLVSVPAGLVALWRAGSISPTPATAQPQQVAAAFGQVPAQPGTVAADAAWPSPGVMTAEGSEPGSAPAGVIPADPAVPPTGTFPIAQVSTPQWAGECIRRALVKEGVPVAEITDVQQQPWGWTCKVRISEGTPSAIIKAAPDLETLMDLETGRCIPTPTKRRAVVDLKVAHTDPFAFVPGPPRRAPKSMSIKDRALLGYAMDARPLEMSLYGVQGAIVAGSGGGKSANIRTFAEYLTACRDTVVVALDPSGVGLGPLEDAAALTLTSKEEIECFLAGMHQVSLKRPELLGKQRMGTEWQPSERWPALVAIGDEWPQNTDASKESGVGIQLTGRKVCAQLLIASQFATTDYIGSAIISNLSLQLLGPCRQNDVTATFGGGAIDDGWLPHRLVPKQADELNDVGKFYLRGGGYNEPIIWRGNWYDDATCLDLAAERAAAGVPQLDEESLRMGGKEFAGLFDKRGTAAKAKARAAAGDRILADTIDALRGASLDRARTERIAELLAALDPTTYSGITADETGRRLRGAGAGGTVKIGPTDGMANPNGYRLADLSEALDATR
ncbi:hypothetical protein [Kitasatospora sp. A2-31]|uniref:hypothetical protein n=1 Tax=Kitasatospora sp. A2-31 TaxID=2916414 RepID=UPI001EEC771E|nr:hypothetical protein [Kitasatospora sp. A2-31]MCG6497627.1 hypothetical protein [Kitasatospora sp. A2-31]